MGGGSVNSEPGDATATSFAGESTERREYYRELFDHSPDALAVLKGQTISM